MKVENYKIWWEYPKTKKNKNTQKTICVISVTDSNSTEGTAKCMKTDEFDKEFGRKLSLTRALNPIPKEDRTKIWEAYRTMSAIPKW